MTGAHPRPPVRAMTYDAYDFDSHIVEIDGRRIHYVDEGAGEAILFLHGNPTWSYLYRHQIRGLRDGYRCVAPDHLGFGLSDKPRDADYGMRAHVERLGWLVEKLELRDLTLVVQDWGGVIGLRWAVDHKEQVKRLVILNTAGFFPRSAGQMLSMRPVPYALPMLWLLKIPGLGELFVQGLNGFARLVPLVSAHRERMTREVTAGYLDPYPTWGSRRAHLRSVRQIPMRASDPAAQLLREIDEKLTGWRVPTQLIWGMKDPVFTSWFLRGFERRLPDHAPSLEIPDAGHFLQDDTPDRITEKIREFLRAYPAGPAAGPRA